MKDINWFFIDDASLHSSNTFNYSVTSALSIKNEI